MNNGIFKVDFGSIVDAAIMGAVFAILAALVTLVSTTGFSVWTADWKMIGESMVDVGFISCVVSLGQALLTTNKGSVLGISPEKGN